MPAFQPGRGKEPMSATEYDCFIRYMEVVRSTMAGFSQKLTKMEKRERPPKKYFVLDAYSSGENPGKERKGGKEEEKKEGSGIGKEEDTCCPPHRPGNWEAINRPPRGPGRRC